MRTVEKHLSDAAIILITATAAVEGGASESGLSQIGRVQWSLAQAAKRLSAIMASEASRTQVVTPSAVEAPASPGLRPEPQPKEVL